MNIVAWMQAHWGLILGTVLVIINEAIAWNPALKQNSLIQLILKLTPPGAAGLQNDLASLQSKQ